MTVTARALNRATLARQLLLERGNGSVADTVRQVVALQAQHPASPYLALWNRVTDLDPAAVDQAFAEHTVVKATLMRMTLHAVHAGDYPVFREAVEPTLCATHLNGRLTPRGLDLDGARGLVRDLLTYAEQPRTGEQVEEWLTPRLGGLSKAGTLRMLRTYAPLVRAPTGGPWSFTQRPSYVAKVPGPTLDDAAAAASLQAYVLHYLTGYGPATVADVAQFALVQQTRVKAALRALDGAVERIDGPDGRTLHDVHGAPLPDEDTPAPPRLMAMWDNTLLADTDRGRVIPSAYRKHVIRANGDVLPTLLVDGYVAGIWRPVDDGIEATAFHRLSSATWDQLAGEAASLVAFLTNREPRVYRRYDRWWNDVPAAQVRVLRGG